MGIMVPAIRAKMGATEYFQAVLTAEELAKTVHAAMDFREFDNFMEAERMQRAMSETRVEQEIVPYLCNLQIAFLDQSSFSSMKKRVSTSLVGKMLALSHGFAQHLKWFQ